jgi:bifunctional DNA-binding transcriptional regulator/antitoxin component of YhaV-PrlF toxin-antitoxin module
MRGNGLVKLYKDGRVWIPVDIRKRFRGYRFGIRVENGKIVFDPFEGENRVFISDGTVYIPSHIRKQFRDCYFSICVENGRIVLEPVRDQYDKGTV